MLKVIGFALYGPLAASTRYRLGQYGPALAQQGIDLTIRHLLGDNYLRRRFASQPLPFGDLLRSGLSRVADLIRLQEYDVAMVHCELFPMVPGWLERALIRTPYVYDFDDAFYLKYGCGKLGMAHALLGRKFERVIAGAAAVTAGSRVLASYARQFNANTHELPTVVDTERYLPRPSCSRENELTVGWIGSPSTAPYLSQLVTPLSEIGKEGKVRFVVIGGKAPVVPHVEVVEVDWSESSEVELINTFDIGVMPLPDDD